ncbi:MAG: UDP-N-acetylmuramate dehydrogenase [Leptospira sp.]|nr:UDP-N-acetylmuramate dehydrogenase [Leptospira sp.]
MVEILYDIPLAPFTTLNLGGKAAYLARCHNEQEVLESLQFAKLKGLPVWILGGGSNTIVSDSGFKGIVIKIEIMGMENLTKENSDVSTMSIGAGVNWDTFVLKSIEEGLAGIECLSGIPGTIGASPIQNIGAYGQEVANSIESVRMITPDFELVEVKAIDCHFSYRNSKFKSGEWKNHIITSVKFNLSKTKSPCTNYPEVNKNWQSLALLVGRKFDRLTEFLEFRNLILSLRKSKSMVLDKEDPNSKSVGSFFTNPLLSQEETKIFLNRVIELGLEKPSLYPDSDNKNKVSAAWLIEKSGIEKGLKYKGVGISSAHCLALVNHNGTSSELLELSDLVRLKVFEKFQINLIREPVFLS